MFKLQLTGADAIKKRFEGMQRRARHGNPFFKRAAIVMHRDVMDHFRQERAPRGKWKPWSAATQKRRGSGKKLQDTGVLRGSILFRGFKENAAVWTNLKYAAVHEFGFKKRNIPKRKYMWLAKNVRKALMERYNRFIVLGRQ